MQNELNKNNSYKINVACDNCGFKGEVEIEKGVEFKNHPCPNCGNRTLYRLFEPIQFGSGYKNNDFI